MPPALFVAIGFSATAAAFASSISISLALSFLSRLLTPKPKAPQDKGIGLTIRSSVAPRQHIYGTDTVGGVLVFAQTSGASNEYLHLVIALAGHEVHAIDDVIFNDVAIPSSALDGNGNVVAGRFGNRARIKKHLGTDDQTADASLISEVSIWNSTHRLRGIAYIYVRLQFDRDVFPTGIPDIRATVRGKKVWDPRSNPSDVSVRSFSNNAALCQLDYAMSSDGFNLSLSEIDLTSWIATANVCDETVALKNSGSPSATQARYTCDGAYQLGVRRLEIMRRLLDASLGTVVWQQGKLRGYAAAATAATAPELTVDDLRGPIQVVTRPSRDALFNRVRGTYKDEQHRHIPTSFAPVTNTTYQTEDNGDPLWEDIQLPFTQSHARAQRIAKLVLDLSRQGMVVRWPAKLLRLDLAVWDTVNVTVADLGFTSKKFRITDATLAEDGGIDFMLREEADAPYTWDPDTEVTIDPAPDTTLPNPFAIAPPGNLSLDSSTAQLLVAGDGSVLSRIRATWTAPADVFVSEYEIEWRNVSAGEDFAPAPRVAHPTLSTFLAPAIDGDSYEVRMRAVNTMGVRSIYGPVTAHVVVGKTEPPPDVGALLVTRLGDGTRRFSWESAVIPPDVTAGGGYEVRYKVGLPGSPDTDWSEMVPLFTQGLLKSSPVETNELAAGTYTFAIKMVDSSGNYSLNATFFETTIGDPRLRGVILYQLEFNLGFPGAKVDCFVNSDGFLEAVSDQGSPTVGTWDQLPSTWDALASSWATIVPNASPITYTSETIDLGANISVTPLGTFDGDGAATITMQIGTEADGAPVGGFIPLATAFVRYIKIKVSVAGTAPLIRNLTIVLDGERIVQDITELDTSSASAGSFERIATGHFKIETDGRIAALISARVTAFRSTGSGWDAELVSTEVFLSGSGSNRPAAEIKIYQNSVLTDGIIDLELKGFKA